MTGDELSDIPSSPEASVPSPAAAPKPATAAPERSRSDPRLSASLSADYEALQNDVQQAHELAADFQGQLAGKSNEVAGLKRVLEKTLYDLSHLQAGIAELRQERHRLANEAMRAVAFEQRLNAANAEREKLRTEMEALRQALVLQTEDWQRQTHAKDAQIARLLSDVQTLERELTAARQAPVDPLPSAADLEVKAALAHLTNKVDRLTDLVAARSGSKSGAAASARAAGTGEEFIDISFVS